MRYINLITLKLHLKIIHVESFIFGLKLLIIYSLDLFDPHKTRKMTLAVFLKFSPEKTGDFRFLQIEKIKFQSRNMAF